MGARTTNNGPNPGVNGVGLFSRPTTVNLEEVDGQGQQFKPRWSRLEMQVKMKTRSVK